MMHFSSLMYPGLVVVELYICNKVGVGMDFALRGLLDRGVGVGSMQLFHLVRWSQSTHLFENVLKVLTPVN